MLEKYGVLRETQYCENVKHGTQLPSPSYNSRLSKSVITFTHGYLDLPFKELLETNLQRFKEYGWSINRQFQTVALRIWTEAGRNNEKTNRTEAGTTVRRISSHQPTYLPFPRALHVALSTISPFTLFSSTSREKRHLLTRKTPAKLLRRHHGALEAKSCGK